MFHKLKNKPVLRGTLVAQIIPALNYSPSSNAANFFYRCFVLIVFHIAITPKQVQPQRLETILTGSGGHAQ